MMNLFSVFDPCTGILSLNWMSSFLLIFFIPFKFWVINNKIELIFSKLMMGLNSEMSNLTNLKGMTLILISLFLVILMNNMPGLMPYIYTSSSQLVFSLALGLPLWLSFMIYGWINKTNSMFSHLVPMGTPGVLMPFMVLIETISNLIRPGSLAVRLTANMIAGHLLMSLLGNNTYGFMIMMYAMVVYLILMLFELAVALIQSYVFMTLTTLYSSED
uniref:ATP synthase subunit a n=1 Tax=Matsumurasca onukii TaxID=2912585 RepID=A0A343UNU2_MATON|nr:ATP synthase F0 subunit 6 [Matsumurasca onukii]AVF91593.1 ATP synthase F0 subunit 6 [Matsumurasca onukii]